MSQTAVDTANKALQINLDASRYGSFAEIGAGQEVVRWFFRVGGASGTVAKSMSAYDMLVSDAIYGKSERYVSKARLQSMLEHEHQLNLERLSGPRGDNTAFFTFADTVAARSFKGGSEWHGWLGVRFQAHPRSADSQIIIHVRMLDEEVAQQQEAIGIAGVNLLFGAFYLHQDPTQLTQSLFDHLSSRRMEVDMIEFSGDAFQKIDNRLMSLKLVQLGLSDAAMFGPDGTVLQPSEVLRKKNILVERGSFRPVVHVNMDMMRCAREYFEKDIVKKPLDESITSTGHGTEGEPVLEIMEITMSNLLAAGELDTEDFLARADVLGACGKTVLISDYSEYFKLGAYLGRYTGKKIGIVMGVPSLKELFNEKYYENLEGGILESFGRLFKNDLKIYVYPLLDNATGRLVTVDNLKVPPELAKLYGHLVDRGCIESIHNFNKDYLSIFSREVLRKIREGEPGWEASVPSVVSDLIKSRGLFGYVPAR